MLDALGDNEEAVDLVRLLCTQCLDLQDLRALRCVEKRFHGVCSEVLKSALWLSNPENREAAQLATWSEGCVERSFSHRALADVLSVCSHDQRLGASGSSDGAAKVWDLRANSNTLACIGTLQHAVPVRCIALHGDTLATGADDGVVRLYSVSALPAAPAARTVLGPFAELRGHSHGVTCVAWAPGRDGTAARLLSTGVDRTLRWWDAAGREHDAAADAEDAETMGAGGAAAAAAAAASQPRVDAPTHTVRRHRRPIRVLGYCDDVAFGFAATGSDDGEVIVWPIGAVAARNASAGGYDEGELVLGQETAAGVPFAVKHSVQEPVAALAVGGGRVVAGWESGLILVWHLPTPLAVSWVARADEIRRSMIARGFDEVGAARMAEAQTAMEFSINATWRHAIRRPALQIQCVGGLGALTLLGSRTLVTAGSGRATTLHVWDLREARRVARLPGHLSTVRSLWSEGGLVLSGDSAGVVRLWESFVAKWARVRGGTGL